MYSVAPHLQQEGWALGEAAPPENLLSLREPVSGGRGPSIPGTGVSARVGLEILRGTMEHSQISQRAANRREAADKSGHPVFPSRPACSRAQLPAPAPGDTVGHRQGSVLSSPRKPSG